MRELLACPDCNLFHVASVAVSAELVFRLKDNYFSGTVSFVMHTVESKTLCEATVSVHISATVIVFLSLSRFLIPSLSSLPSPSPCHPSADFSSVFAFFHLLNRAILATL